MESGIQKAVRLANGQSNLGRRIKRTAQCVQRWVAKGKPSQEGALLIERALGGQVTRAELLPELFAPIPDGA